MSESINIVDISSCTKYQLFVAFLKSLVSSRRIVLIPGPNLLRLIAWFSVIGFAGKFVIVAVGGWMPEIVRDEKRVFNFLRKVNSVWVQTAGLQGSLKSAGIKADLLLNFKNGLVPIRPSRRDSPRLKVVFFSRVSKEKGIFEAIEAVSRMTAFCDLDIYGPLHGCSLDLQNIGNVRYLGVLDGDEIQLRLSSYDLLLFPTYYPGEGFPGVLIDALFSGITVIASNWKFNSEVVKDYKNGLLLDEISSSAIEAKILELYMDSALLERLRMGAHNASLMYEADKVMVDFLNCLHKGD